MRYIASVPHIYFECIFSFAFQLPSVLNLLTEEDKAKLQPLIGFYVIADAWVCH
jgi:hypothetical protein